MQCIILVEEGSALCDIIANSSTTSSPSPYEISNAKGGSCECFSSSSACCGLRTNRRIRGSLIGMHRLFKWLNSWYDNPVIFENILVHL